MPFGKDPDKSEPATAKRKQKAREEGQVAMSREVQSVMVLFGSIGALFFSGAWMFRRLSGLMASVFWHMGTAPLDVESAPSFLWKMCQDTVEIILPVMLTVMVAGIAASLMQVGFMISPKAFSPKLSKLNPINGLSRFVSLRSAVELAKSMVKISLVGSVAYISVRKEAAGFPALVDLSTGEILSYISAVTLRIGGYTCLALAVLAILDYAFQRWQHEQDLRMSKQEIKDEFKQSEGDPKVKARIRKLQMEMTRRRMMEKVPEADAVVTNPTHIAVALKYEPGKMAAPQVVAKGAGFIAERIKEIARDRGIPVIENKPLARALYKSVDIGKSIPSELYKAVAEILAYVYRLRARGRRSEVGGQRPDA